jgi:ATP-dependent helicase/nuclease subunit A
MMLELTKAQRRAIETIDNNISVSAGAGSGKTRVLTERFTNILMQKASARKTSWRLRLRARRPKKCARESESAQGDARVKWRHSFWQEQLRALDKNSNLNNRQSTAAK